MRSNLSRTWRFLPAVCAASLPLLVWVVAGWGAPGRAPTAAQLLSRVDPPLHGLARKRLAVLRAIPGDPSALVNVRREILPATNDMTLLGKAALPALERGLTHNVKSGVRLRLASVLRELADHHSRGTLTAALKDWDPSVRQQAILGLSAIGDLGTAPALLGILDDPEERQQVKTAAVRALGWVGASQAAQRLLRLLGREKEPLMLRRAAQSALWDLRHRLPAAQTRRGLTIALGCDDSYMRTVAAAGAAELRDADPALRRVLIKRLRDADATVRNLAVYALGEIGHRAAIAPLRARLPAARSARLLNNIAFALRKLGDRRVMPLLGTLLAHRLAVIRLNAAFVLGDIGDTAAVPMLIRALTDPNDFVRASVISALGQLKDRRAIPRLTPFVSGKNLSLKQEALFALNRITGGAYSDRIATDLLWHTRAPVRRAAALELARRQDPRAIRPLLLCRAEGQCTVTTVARALAKIPAARATGPLLMTYSKQGGESGAAASLLRALGRRSLKPGHRDVLRSLLSASRWKPRQRRALLRLLGRLGDRPARETFWANLGSRDTLARYNAAYALANQGYAEGRKQLLVALTQSAPRIQRGVADLIRSLTHPGARAALRTGLQGALRGHGPFVRLAAAYALTSWDAPAGVKILLAALSSNNRRLRNEAAYYLMRPEIRQHRGLIAGALAAEKRRTQQGTLRRILRHITPGALKAKVLDWVNL